MPRVPLILLTLVIPASVGAQDPKSRAQFQSHLRQLERTALGLAGKGRGIEFAMLLEALQDLGHSQKAMASVRKRGQKALGRAKARKPAPGAARSLSRIADRLGSLLDKLPAASRGAAARAVLRIDGSVVSAHDALGHVEFAGNRIPKDVRPLFERRRAMQVGLQACRKLTFEFTELASTLPPVGAFPGKGRQVAWKSVSVHSPTLSAERLRRILTTALRTWAYHQFLRTGDVAPPEVPHMKVVLLRSRAEYLTAVEEALANGGIEKRYAKAARESWGVHRDEREFQTGWSMTEAAHAAYVLRELSSHHYRWILGGDDPEPVPPNLHIGHLDYLAKNFIGADVPSWGWVEIHEKKVAPGTSTNPQETAERKELVQLARTGMPGVRAYLRYLVKRGEDPKISATLVDRAGFLAGELRLKSIVLVEYLHEAGRYFPLFEASRGKPVTVAAFIGLLGHDLGTLETRWREWLLADDNASSIVDRLDRNAAKRTHPAALDHLNRLRRSALAGVANVVPTGHDEAVSSSCKLHAKYLLLNPKQLAAWPDCHEEYSDREGFTPAGCWAGGHSVIDPGAKTGEQAIDRWMATFYHRLPLLHPGLLRIGWAHEGGVAVLDSGSLVDHAWASPTAVAWPHSGARKVPLGFVPEMPSPVPGADQTKWGYPVTLQLFGQRQEPIGVLRLRLYRGSVKPANEVTCHWSTPDAPTNPRLAPRDTWCLIPKTRLAPRTTYIVVIENPPPDAGQLAGGQWRFTTGAK